MRFVVLTLWSWLAGFTAYLLALNMFYGQQLSRGDVLPVVFWSLAVSAVLLPTLYAPVLLALRRVLGGCQPAYWFPFMGALMGLLPTILIVRAFGGAAASLWSHEARLFHCMFVGLGLAFGFGFLKIFGREPKSGMSEENCSKDF